MPRTSRVVAVGSPHHVTQRGNHRLDVFTSDQLRRVYLGLLKEHGGRYGLRVLAYCLMSNHVHLVVAPERETSLAATLRHAHGRFAQYWNTVHEQTGHLWQNRFFSCPVDPGAVWRVVRYVEQNPVRAGMTRRAIDYPWSSARYHAGVAPSEIVSSSGWEWSTGDWLGLLDGSSEAEWGEIRRATYSGRPYGSEQYVRQLEQTLGRRLMPSKGGRPRTWKTKPHQLCLSTSAPA
ncbi:MAG TPA: transposase [Solibacterales bacterium]|nr:transposase [Bryobacterales bacterium]